MGPVAAGSDSDRSIEEAAFVERVFGECETPAVSRCPERVERVSADGFEEGVEQLRCSGLGGVFEVVDGPWRASVEHPAVRGLGSGGLARCSGDPAERALVDEGAVVWDVEAGFECSHDGPAGFHHDGGGAGCDCRGGIGEEGGGLCRRRGCDGEVELTERATVQIEHLDACPHRNDATDGDAAMHVLVGSEMLADGVHARRANVPRFVTVGFDRAAGAENGDASGPWFHDALLFPVANPFGELGVADCEVLRSVVEAQLDAAKVGAPGRGPSAGSAPLVEDADAVTTLGEGVGACETAEPSANDRDACFVRGLNQE